MLKTRQSLEDFTARALGALGNKTRLRIFRLLNRAGRDGLIIGEVQRHMGVPASTMAHHLSTLTQAGLVIQERRGRAVVCTADFEAMNGLTTYLTEHCCTGVQAAKEAA